MMHAFGMSTMRYCGTSFVRVALASLLGTLAAFGLNSAVLAAGACIEGPNLNAGKGRHWSYRVDRIKHRKCWYVMETGPKTHEDAPLESTPTPKSRRNLTLFSWFTSGSASAGMQPSTTKESRLPPATPRRTVKFVHAVATERSRPARPPEAKGAATAERNQQSPPRSSAENPEEVKSQPPDQGAQDALFLEFLRWNELRKSVK